VVHRPDKLEINQTAGVCYDSLRRGHESDVVIPGDVMQCRVGEFSVGLRTAERDDTVLVIRVEKMSGKGFLVN
jgi:hypothetical protein